MGNQGKIISLLMVICLIASVASAVCTDKITAESADRSRTRICLKINSQIISGKTITVKSGTEQKIKVMVLGKKKYKITFRSDNPRVMSVSKNGKIKAKKSGSAKITALVKIKGKKYKCWTRIRVSSSNSREDLNMNDITLKVNGHVFSAKLYDTEAGEALLQKLPLTITMNELNGNEKYYYFSEHFPTEAKKVSRIQAGDLKLYGSSCLVLFYKSFATSYSYTSLGYVEDPEGLVEALGKGSVKIVMERGKK